MVLAGSSEILRDLGNRKAVPTLASDRRCLVASADSTRSDFPRQRGAVARRTSITVASFASTLSINSYSPTGSYRYVERDSRCSLPTNTVPDQTVVQRPSLTILAGGGLELDFGARRGPVLSHVGVRHREHFANRRFQRRS